MLWSELCFRNINLVVGARMDERIEVTLHNQAETSKGGKARTRQHPVEVQEVKCNVD